VVRNRERDVLKHEPDEVALRDRLCGRAEHLRAEVGEAAVGDDDKVREERLLPDVVRQRRHALSSSRTLVRRRRGVGRRGLARRAHADDAVRELALDELRDGRLDDVDVRLRAVAGLAPSIRVGVERVAELADEAAVVERAALGAGRVRDLDELGALHDRVPSYRDGVDAVDAVAQTQGAQRAHAARLEQLADDPVRGRERALEDADAERPRVRPGLVRALRGRRVGRRRRGPRERRERVREGRACDAGADDEDVVVGVPGHGVRCGSYVSGVRGVRRRGGREGEEDSKVVLVESRAMISAKWRHHAPPDVSPGSTSNLSRHSRTVCYICPRFGLLSQSELT
jgi:hypothetical protein